MNGLSIQSALGGLGKAERTNDWRRLTPQKIAEMASYEREDLLTNLLRNQEAIRNDRSMAADLMRLERILSQLGATKDAASGLWTRPAGSETSTSEPGYAVLGDARAGKKALDAQYEAAAQQSAAPASRISPRAGNNSPVSPLESATEAVATGPSSVKNTAAQPQAPAPEAVLPDSSAPAGADPWAGLFDAYKSQTMDPSTARTRALVEGAGQLAAVPAPLSTATEVADPMVFPDSEALDIVGQAPTFGDLPRLSPAEARSRRVEAPTSWSPEVAKTLGMPPDRAAEAAAAYSWLGEGMGALGGPDITAEAAGASVLPTVSESVQSPSEASDDSKDTYFGSKKAMRREMEARSAEVEAAENAEMLRRQKAVEAQTGERDLERQLKAVAEDRAREEQLEDSVKLKNESQFADSNRNSYLKALEENRPGFEGVDDLIKSGVRPSEAAGEFATMLDEAVLPEAPLDVASMRGAAFRPRSPAAGAESEPRKAATMLGEAVSPEDEAVYGSDARHRAPVTPSIVSEGQPPLKLTQNVPEVKAGDVRGLDKKVVFEGDTPPWLKSFLKDAGIIDEEAWPETADTGPETEVYDLDPKTGRRMGTSDLMVREPGSLDTFIVETPPPGPESEYFITQRPPRPQLTDRERALKRDNQAKIQLLAETLGRRSAGYFGKPMPELTTPKLYGMNDFEKQAIDQGLKKAEIQRQLQERGIDRDISENRWRASERERFRDNERAIHFQLTKLSEQSSSIEDRALQERAKLLAQGVSPAVIEGQLKSFRAREQGRIANERARLQQLLNDNTGRLSALEALPPVRSNPYQLTPTAPVGAPANAAPAPTATTSAGVPGVAPRAGGSARVGAPAGTVGAGAKDPMLEEDEENRSMSINGKKFRLKSALRGQLPKVIEATQTFDNAFGSIKDLQTVSEDFFRTVRSSPDSIDSMLDRVTDAIAINGAQANAAGKALAAEGLSSTVSSLHGAESSLQADLKSLASAATAYKLARGSGVGEPLARKYLETMEAKTKKSLAAYNRVLTHAAETYIEKYGEREQSGGGGKTFKVSNGAETKVLSSPEAVKKWISAFPDFKEVR